MQPVKNQHLSIDNRFYHDMKMAAQKDQKSALPKVAKQFESLFIQQLMKQMRQSNSFLAENNPLKTKQVEQFQEMLDQETAIRLADNQGIGLADTLIRQLEKILPSNQTKKINQASYSLKKPIKAYPIAHNNKPFSLHAINKNDKADLPLPDFEKLLQMHGTEGQDMEYENKKAFITAIWPYAKKAAEEIGLDPKMLVAQAALETGWGKYVIEDKKGNSSHNLFNIKTSSHWQGNKINQLTTEFEGKVAQKLHQSFKQYDSILDSFNDYIGLIKDSPRYQQALGLARNAKDYIKSIHQAGYATDPKYSEKIIKIYEGDELNQSILALEDK